MTIRGELRLKFKSNGDALRVLDSIAPDNYPLPQGLQISNHVTGNVLHLKITTERGVESFMATIEDLLSSVDLALRTFSSIDQKA